MVTVPAVVWQGGPVRRGVTVGICVGLFSGVLAWLDSGMVLGGITVFVVLGITSGVWMSRRMRRYWPGARDLTGPQRVLVVNAVRRARPIRDVGLAPAVLDYSRGLHAAAENTKPWRWIVVVLLLVAMVMALWDAVMGSPGNAVASFIYVLLIGLEMTWWPSRRDELLVNADRAASWARQTLIAD